MSDKPDLPDIEPTVELPNTVKRIPKNFRLNQNAIDMIVALAEAYGVTEGYIIEQVFDRYGQAMLDHAKVSTPDKET